jgi:RNA polymerase sigma-70 factor (ECF subfamily)
MSPRGAPDCRVIAAHLARARSVTLPANLPTKRGMAPRPAPLLAPLRLIPREEEDDLVARCVAREPAALRTLFERERHRVHALLYRVVGSNTHMDDLLQDTFLEVFRSLPGFRGESSLSTWINRCAVRVAYAHFGRKARMPALEQVPELRPESPSTEERASYREALRRLYAELDRIEPRQRLAFTLFVLENRSLREVAEIMDSSLATAKIRVWRARRTLEARAKMDPLLSEFSSDDDGRKALR